MARVRYLLLLLPFAALLYPPFYNRLEPAFFGFPFFYAYQLLWVALTGIIIAIVLLWGQARQ